MNYKMICELSEEEFDELELPFPLDTTYYEIVVVDDFGNKRLVAYSDYFYDEDSVEKVKYLKDNFGKTIFLTQKEADDKVELIIKK